MCHGDDGRLARCSFKSCIAWRESIDSVETALFHLETGAVSAGRIAKRRTTTTKQTSGDAPGGHGHGGPGEEGTAEAACESERGQFRELEGRTVPPPRALEAGRRAGLRAGTHW